jgi:hypothetical protein
MYKTRVCTETEKNQTRLDRGIQERARLQQNFKGIEQATAREHVIT